MNDERSTEAAEHLFADDPRAYSAGRAAHESRVRFAKSLGCALVGAAGGPFVQRRPTRLEYESLRQPCLYYAQRFREGWKGFASRAVQTRLQTIGITVEQVEQAARGML